MPGLGGKGIIDIYIVAPRVELDKISSEVISSGYEYRPRFSPDQHVFHRIDLPDSIERKRKYHVYFSYPDAEDYKQALAFRDYLRLHPEDVKVYEEAKKKAVIEATQDKYKYMAIKFPAIKAVLEKVSKISP